MITLQKLFENAMSPKKNDEKEPLESNLANVEFVDRVTRLLIVCMEGICSLLPQKEALHGKLNGMNLVLKKAIRVKPISDMVKEIQDYFIRKKLEEDFAATEKEELKTLVVDLTETLKDMITASGDFGGEVSVHIDEIKKASTLTEIRVIKDKIVADLHKVREQSMSLKEELDDYRKLASTLSQQLESSEAKAMVDSLTNVLNRNAYDKKIAQLIREADRLQSSESALMVVDIDHFKKFNDNHGHKAGDNVLAAVASSIRDTIRATDSLFRYGGEEFVVILNNITADNAEKLAEKVRYRVEKEYFVDKEKTLKVTVSIGMTCLKEKDTEQTLFERADKAMYNSKHKGRNRVTVA